MENQRNPRIKENQNQLKVFFSLQGQNSCESVLEKVTEIHEITICRHRHLADALVIQNDNRFLIEIPLLQAKEYFLPFDNLQTALLSLKTVTPELIKIIKKSFFHKNTLRRQAKAKKINLFKNFSAGSKQKDIYPIGLFEKISALHEFQIISKKINQIEDIPTAIIKTSQLKAFKTAQLLIHHKGSSISNNIISDQHSPPRHAKIPVDDFNKIFTLIKKSKHKQFNQSNLLQKNLGVIGTFLAKDVNLEKHNLIIIISRNDFLPSFQNEQEHFEALIQYLIPHLSVLLSRHQLIQKKNYIKLAIDHLPAPVTITDKNNKIVYFNSDKENSDKKNYRSFSQLNFKDSYKISIGEHITNHETSDIYHYQRISLLGELLNTLKHELNNPIYGVKLTSDILKNESNEDFATTMSEINSNCTRCQKIIDSFSNLYSPTSNFISINLCKILNEIITLTKSESHGINKEIILKNISSEFMINTNQTWLTQIIFNFIINAAQSIRSLNNNISNHKITVTVFQNTSLNMLDISVSDTGTGIPDHLLEKILSPFVTTKEKGTGLGLAICNGLARKLNGSISFANNHPAPGATFTLSIMIEMLQ